MNYVSLLTAPWHFIHIERLVFQHAAMIVGAGILGLAFSLLLRRGILSSVVEGVQAIGRFTSKSLAFKVGLLAVALSAFVGVALLVLQNFSTSADEYSCVFLAKCFASGKLFGLTDSLKDFFHFTHIGEKGGKWFSVYPPGWPMILAIGLKLGVPWLMSPLLAVSSLVLTFCIGRKVGDRRVAFLACFWVGASSFFLFHAGSYYSHMACLFLLCAFVWAVMLATERRANGWFFLAGLILGYAMITRYLSAMAFAMPFCLYLLYRLVKVRDIKFIHLFSFTLGLAIFNLLQLWYQYQVTGDPFLTPIHYMHEHERLGFRRDYMPWVGVERLAFRTLFYADWVVPGFWVLAVLAYFLHRESTWDKLFLWAGFLCGASYILYYSYGGNQFGPRYFFESIAVLGVMGSKMFFKLWDRWKGSYLRPILGFALLLGFVFNVINVAEDMSLERRVTRERKSLYNVVAKEKLSNSVVFVRDWIGSHRPLPPTDLTRNSPNRDDDVLYVVDRGQENVLLMKAMPQRDFYVGTYDRRTGIAGVKKIDYPTSKGS